MQNSTVFDCQFAKFRLFFLFFDWNYHRFNESSCLQSNRENDVVFFVIQHFLFFQCDKLVRILKFRFIDKFKIKIIVVDEFNSDFIKFMLHFFPFQIINHVKNMIRIFDDDWIWIRMLDVKNTIFYKKYIIFWFVFWNDVYQISSKILAGFIIKNEFDDHQQIYFLYVNIIFFFSLNVSQRTAYFDFIQNAYSDDEHWHWFAEFWRNQFKSNMIIFMNNHDEEHFNANVMKIEQ